MITESQLDNILVAQKDGILFQINRGDFDAAFAQLACVRELWFACNYGYKFKELIARIDAESKKSA